MTFRQASGHPPESVVSIDWLGTEEGTTGSAQPDVAPGREAEIKDAFNDALGQHLVDWQPDRTKRARVQTALVGVHIA